MHGNKKLKPVTKMKINRLIYCLAVNSLSECGVQTGEYFTRQENLGELFTLGIAKVSSQESAQEWGGHSEQKSSHWLVEEGCLS